MDKKKTKILIADDDTHVHEMLNVVLSSDEFEIIHAYDGQETVQRVNDELPDLVVLDIMMSIKDGRDICRDRIVGLEVGADDYETKPFSPDSLVRKIKRMYEKE